uniref:Uncharacterized protein n=1 Tax=Arundo donax TaxID=35708 RepID=A0A0A9BT08_ARUDO
MTHGWLSNFSSKIVPQVLVGAGALFWDIWLTRNNIVFDKEKNNSYMQVIFRSMH